MEGHEPATAGERWAEIYDDWHPGYEETAITALADLAHGGRALELGIGTGRIALPLAARGVEVHGIDASPAMVARLRVKPGGAAVPVTIGDFAEVGVDGRFSLIFVAFNTFFALATQEAQVRCFRRVADHLSNGGVFVVEAFVPDLTRFSRG
jgi:SAM-dependent methyltransferase